jgi:hypothetical protein
MSTYEQPKRNEWVQPIRKGYKMACCDCGLVHEMDFRIVRGKGWESIQFRVRRNNRATAGIRRGMGWRKNADGTYNILHAK